MTRALKMIAERIAEWGEWRSRMLSESSCG